MRAYTISEQIYYSDAVLTDIYSEDMKLTTGR